MISQIQDLKDRLEKSNEVELSETEIAYLEGVQSVDDVSKFDHQNEQLVALAYDAAITLGLSKTAALIATGEAPAEHATIIKLHYHDGEYLSGYTLHGDQAKLMEQIGLAKYVGGWGHLVNDVVVEKLGTYFEYRAAWEMAQPALQNKRDFDRMEKESIERIFAEAKRTGDQQVLDSYSAECNDPREECDIDSVTVYAMPDGSRKTVRSHTW